MLLKIKVHTNTSQIKVQKINDFEYEVWVMKKPENNKANLELVKLLKKYFKKDVKIKSGFTSRNKVIEIN